MSYVLYPFIVIFHVVEHCEASQLAQQPQVVSFSFLFFSLSLLQLIILKIKYKAQLVMLLKFFFCSSSIFSQRPCFKKCSINTSSLQHANNRLQQFAHVCSVHRGNPHVSRSYRNRTECVNIFFKWQKMNLLTAQIYISAYFVSKTRVSGVFLAVYPSCHAVKGVHLQAR